jgi:UDP-glucose 4-epimerase
MARTVLVTGAAGYLGSVLVSALARQADVAKVVALDLKAPAKSDPKVVPVAGDIRDEALLRRALESEGVDSVLHLAFMMGEPHDEEKARSVNIGGTLAVLRACQAAPSVRKLVFSGSASAYGAVSGNPPKLRETDPLRAATLRYGIHKRQVEEELAKELPGVRDSLRVVMLRICTIVGPSERTDGPVKLFCEMPATVSVLRSPGGLQFIHEADLVRVFLRALEAPELRGAYNVAPDDFVTLPQLSRALAKPCVPLPYSALWTALFLARRALRRDDLTENVVSYLAYPVVLDNSKIKKELGVDFPRGSLDAFLECAKAAGGAR